jgi:nicotinamidase-related amidase
MSTGEYMPPDKYSINPQNSLFLLIDFQANLAAAMEKEVYENSERNVGLMVSACNVLQMPIIVTEQYRKGLGQTVERVREKLGEAYRPIDKMEFSCLANPPFMTEFRRAKRDHIVVAGIESHVCVLQTVLDLVSDGHRVHILSDGVCSRYKTDWEAAIGYMRDAGAVISTTEIVVFQLLKKAGTPEFKSLSPLFKNKESYWSR